MRKEYSVGPRRRIKVIKDISLTISKPEVVSLIGLNGAGKTTLLKIMAGITRPTSGAVTIFDRDVLEPDARTQLGFLPENPQFYDDLTARQFLRHVGGLFSLTKMETRRETERWLKTVGLADVGRQPIRIFSKGMRQRLGFAQAMIGRPKLLLLDEPSDGLDPLGRLSLKEQIMAAKKAGVAIVISSHILYDIAELADRVGLIDHGQLKKLEPTARFIGRHKNLEEAFVSHLKLNS